MFGSIQAIWWEGGLNMAVRSNAFVRSVTGFAAFELVDVLADQARVLQAVSKQGVGTHVFLKRSLFACGILHRLLLRVFLRKPTSAPLRF
jgi:hypothetical protein